VLQCVAVCCSVLQCVAEHTPSTNYWAQPLYVCRSVCCSVLQCVAVCCRTHSIDKLLSAALLCVSQYVLQCVAVCCSVCYNVLQCAAGCCRVLQCVAVYCILLQDTLHRQTSAAHKCDLYDYAAMCVAVCCSVLQCVAEHTPSTNSEAQPRKKTCMIMLQCVCSVLQFAAVRSGVW